MKAMVEEGRRRDPDWMFAMEACSDALGQFADVNLISPASARKDGLWGATRRFAPEVFHYTFPEYILYNGVANGLYQKSEDDCLLDAHLLGNRYDVFSAQPAARYMALRRCTKQLLYRARFVDNLGVVSSNPAVRAKSDILQDEQNDARIVNIANPTGKAGVSVEVEKAPASGYFFDLDGGEGVVTLRKTAGGVAFIAPVSRASTVVIATKCEPIVRVPVASAVAGEQGSLRVTVTNVGERPVSGKLLLEGAPGRAVSVTVAAGASAEASLTLPAHKASFRGCLAGHVRFEGAGMTVRRPFEALITSSFATAANLRRQSVRVTVRNLGKTPRRGSLAISGPPWPAPLKQALSVAAGATAGFDLPLTASAAAAISEPVALDIAITSGGDTEHQSAVIGPALLNGDFERAGEGNRPASWDYQQAQQAAADTANPASGKVCLKLVGKQGLFVEAHQFLTVEPGGTYEAHCRMRRTPGAAATVGPTIVLLLKTGGERYVPLAKATNLPDDQWNDYAASFTVSDDVSRTAMYLYNVNSEATVWYDGASVE
jgi:hypothetical protein